MPTEDEILEYAKWLGMDAEKDKELMWIAREGLKAPLPADWKPCKTQDTEEIYYFNFSTGDSSWDHPCDGFYRKLYEEHRLKAESEKDKGKDRERRRAKKEAKKLKEAQQAQGAPLLAASKLSSAAPLAAPLATPLAPVADALAPAAVAPLLAVGKKAGALKAAMAAAAEASGSGGGGGGSALGEALAPVREEAAPQRKNKLDRKPLSNSTDGPPKVPAIKVPPVHDPDEPSGPPPPVTKAKVPKAVAASPADAPAPSQAASPSAVSGGGDDAASPLASSGGSLSSSGGSGSRSSFASKKFGRGLGAALSSSSDAAAGDDAGTPLGSTLLRETKVLGEETSPSASADECHRREEALVAAHAAELKATTDSFNGELEALRARAASQAAAAADKARAEERAAADARVAKASAAAGAAAAEGVDDLREQLASALAARAASEAAERKLRGRVEVLEQVRGDCGEMNSFRTLTPWPCSHSSVVASCYLMRSISSHPSS